VLVIEASGVGPMEYTQLRAAVLCQDGDKAGAEVWLRVIAVMAEMGQGAREVEFAQDRGGP
jgi:DNA primase